MRGAALAVVLAVVGAGLAHLHQAGLFQHVYFSLVPMREMRVVATSRRAAYRNSGEVFMSLGRLLKHEQELSDDPRYVGVYWDDPQEVGRGQCALHSGRAC